MRRETSPCLATSVYVVITYVPWGKFEIGPRSTSPVSIPSPMKDGSTMKPSAGTVTAAPMTAPSPSVVTLRKVARS